VLCCDAPAKSFVLKVKGHSGFSSCTRCKIEGEYMNNRVCFPYTQIKSTTRSHQDYVNLADEDYHVGNEILLSRQILILYHLFLWIIFILFVWAL